MFQTFNQNQFLLQSGLLRHGELAWLARSTYFGDQRNYLETHIDDNFLADDTWDTTTHTTDYDPADALREIPADVTAAVNWSAQNNFRIDMLYNGGRQHAAARDPLLTAFRAAKNSFGWINHTWDHPNLDQGCAPAAYIESEITQNNSLGDERDDRPRSNVDHRSDQGARRQQPGCVRQRRAFRPGEPRAREPRHGRPAGLQRRAHGDDRSRPADWARATYTYAITDQFSPTGGESSASTTQVVVAAPVAPNTGSSVTVTWDAVCHAADYKIYRQNPDLHVDPGDDR